MLEVATPCASFKCTHEQEAPLALRSESCQTASLPTASLSLLLGYFLQLRLTSVFPEKPKKFTWEMSPHPLIESRNETANGTPYVGGSGTSHRPGDGTPTFAARSP